MSWIRTIFAELVGLFVDDGSFALAIVAWLGIAWLMLPQLPAAGEWKGPILFVGLAIVLVESVACRARR
jgi:hypothetical protein